MVSVNLDIVAGEDESDNDCRDKLPPILVFYRAKEVLVPFVDTIAIFVLLKLFQMLLFAFFSLLPSLLSLLLVIIRVLLIRVILVVLVMMMVMVVVLLLVFTLTASLRVTGFDLFFIVPQLLFRALVR